VEKKTIDGHFSDIKQLVVHISVLFLLSFSVCYYFSGNIITIAQNRLLPVTHELHYFSVIEPFFLQLKVAFMVALMSSMPFILLRCGVYLLPVVRQKSSLMLYCIFGCILFFCGVFLAFEYLMPVVITMMLKMGGSMIFMLHASSFFGMIFILLFACGVVLEVPLVMLALVKFNIITIGKLKKFRKFYIALSFIAGAVFTPPDVISQVFVAGLMILLFEITLFLLSLCKGTKE
jgi:sec-independent protein translocase protein TatC